MIIINKKYRYHGAGVLLWYKEGSEIFVLLGKRLFSPMKNNYSVPGGGYEIKDGIINNKRNYKNTAIRETFEEIGLQIKINKEAFWKIKTFFFNWELFEAQCDEKIILKNFNEFSNLEWFNIKKLPQKAPLLLKFQIKKLNKKIN